MQERHQLSTTALRSLVLGASLCAAFASLAASSAHATPSIATSGPPKEPGERRNELNLGLLAGATDVGQDKRQTIGLQVSAGRRFGDLVLLAEYDYLSLGKPTSDTRGSLSRMGVTARYSLLRTSAKPQNGSSRRGPVTGDYWLEMGAGVQRIAWDKGGVVHRPDLALGFGWQLDAVIGRRSPKPRYYGPYVGFRANVTRAPESTMAMPSMCAGPCDTATPPPGTDVSLMFHAGVNWGR